MHAVHALAIALAGAALLTSCTERPDAAKPGAADVRGPKLELPPGIDAAAPAAVATSTVPKTIYRSHFAMGTQLTLTAYTIDEAGALAAFDEVFREFDRLDALLTVWRDTSDVARINAAAGKAPVVVSAETIDVLQRAIDGSARTKGRFDVTFGALSGLWKFDHDQDNRIPPRAEVLRRLALVDYRKLKVDPAAKTAFLEREGMRVHLGGIGKGYAVDRGVATMRARGLTDFMVQAGGDLYVAGRHGDRAWRVGIRDPRGPPDRYFAAAEVTDATFSTSGDYERFFLDGGRRYHHILDPKTGEPATKVRAVTIMAPNATTAEWLSKGLFILGVDEGMPIVEATPGAGAVAVDAKNQLHVSKRLEGKIKVFMPPTDAP
ncbi:FAD:protein FMN transferase [Myxococcota bacterium]|nr:FAD:protein FMN transferase [Myxococcota bacterium]